MADADGEVAESIVWLNVSSDCGYMDAEVKNRLLEGYREVGRMLGGMMRNPERFLPR